MEQLSQCFTYIMFNFLFRIVDKVGNHSHKNQPLDSGLNPGCPVPIPPKN